MLPHAHVAAQRHSRELGSIGVHHFKLRSDLVGNAAGLFHAQAAAIGQAAQQSTHLFYQRCRRLHSSRHDRRLDNNRHRALVFLGWDRGEHSSRNVMDVRAAVTTGRLIFW